MIEALNQQTIPTLLSAIVVVLGLNLLFRLGEFTWGLVQKKSESQDKMGERLTMALESNTKALEKLENRLKDAEEKLAEVPKVKTDLRRLFAATKVLAGEEWPAIRQAILDEELPNQ